jgi:acetolactate synthase-1/2/3 large subunit
MGFGLPAALGAKFAFPDKISINFSGDGSILMNIQDLMTATEHKKPMINIVLNNNYLGMVRQWQTLFYEDRLASSVIETQPDFVKLVEAFGGVGFRVTKKEEFEEALNSAIKRDVPAIIEVIISRREQVLPMIPTGGALYNMILTEQEPKNA